MIQKIIIKDLPNGLNGSNGLIRGHWTKLKKEKEKWYFLVLQKYLKKHQGTVEIEFTRVSTRMMDYDNLGASFKFIGDALVRSGVLIDDSPKIVKSLTTKWEKAKNTKEQHVIIEIKDVNE